MTLLDPKRTSRRQALIRLVRRLVDRAGKTLRQLWEVSGVKTWSRFQRMLDEGAVESLPLEDVLVIDRELGGLLLLALTEAAKADAARAKGDPTQAAGVALHEVTDMLTKTAMLIRGGLSEGERAQLRGEALEAKAAIDAFLDAVAEPQLKAVR